MKLFGWSPLVEDAFKTNQPLFTLSRKLPPPTPELQYPPIPGLLALHVRRGDFEGHCTLLVSWKVPFSGLNNQPGTIDKDVQLVENEDGSLSQASRDALQRACYPDTDQIVERVRQIRETEEGKKLRNVFIMTNGSPEWVQELEEALMKDHKWEQIASSLQMHVSWEQKFVAQAVDMMIGHRADVFIGNGVNLPLGLLLSLSLTPSFLFSTFLVLEFYRGRLHAPHRKRPRGWASKALGVKWLRSFPWKRVSSSHLLRPTRSVRTTPLDDQTH